jgi:poly(3-hydroxybutyrate) depolymerase
MKLSRWNELADEENFIVVYPRGSGFPLRWRTNRLGESLLDMQFIADLIDQLQQEYNIDQLQIYANGLFWPGGDPLPEWIVGHTSDDINATQTMWEFFQQHTLNE